MNKVIFVAGAAVGYVLGTKAGRQRYEQIAGAARQVASQPNVKQAITEVQTQATRAYDAAKTAVTEKLGSAKADGTTTTLNGTSRTKPLPVDDQTTVGAL